MVPQKCLGSFFFLGKEIQLDQAGKESTRDVLQHF